MTGKNKMIPLVMLFLFSLNACEEVLQPSLESKKVTAIAPVDNVISTMASQTFYWETIDGATKYQLQIVSPKFDSVVQLITDTSIAINQFTYSLQKGSYQWRVRAKNESTQSGYSDIRKMTIQ